MAESSELTHLRAAVATYFRTMAAETNKVIQLRFVAEAAQKVCDAQTPEDVEIAITVLRDTLDALPAAARGE